MLSDLLAAVLDAQLDKMAEIQRRRESVVRRYREGLAAWAQQHGVRLPPELKDRQPNHHIFYLLLPDEAARDRGLEDLKKQGVMATFHYVPLHSAPYGRALGAGPRELPVTDRVARTLLRLPLHPGLTESDVARVIEAVHRTRL